MGLPVIDQWLCERYPHIAKPVPSSKERFNQVRAYSTGQQVEVDKFYISLNGLIHSCCPHASPKLFFHSEEDIFINIAAYLDRLISAVRPKQFLMLALNGAAPRLRINKIRMENYRTFQQNLKKDKNNTNFPWNRNAVLPGTLFMANLAEYLRAFVFDRMNNCSEWRNIKVILSDDTVPGEGQYKIMSYIRLQQGNETFDVNESHALFGMDRDLSIIGLASHEPFFTVVRENKIKTKGVFGGYENSEFQYIHINILRDYLWTEFEAEKDNVNFEKMIDDFVFLCLLAVNNFLPPFLCMDIHQGSMDFLLNIYKNYHCTYGNNYLTDAESKDLNVKAVMHFFSVIGNVEKSMLVRQGRLSKFECNAQYYRTKFNVKYVPQNVAQVVESYLNGLRWSLKYYYDQCVSWNWYYSFHYAPFFSDFSFCGQVNITSFNLGQPPKLLHQLFHLLPPSSSCLLPKPFQDILTSNYSSVSSFFPNNVKIDSNGRKLPWNHVAITPFINENLLVSVIEEKENSLQDQGFQREEPGHELLFIHSLAPVIHLPCTDKDVGQPVCLPSNIFPSGTIIPTKCPLNDGIWISSLWRKSTVKKVLVNIDRNQVMCFQFRKIETTHSCSEHYKKIEELVNNSKYEYDANRIPQPHSSLGIYNYISELGHMKN